MHIDARKTFILSLFRNVRTCSRKSHPSFAIFQLVVNVNNHCLLLLVRLYVVEFYRCLLHSIGVVLF